MNPDNLHCIDLDIPEVEGFRQFISCWLYNTPDCAFVVDPGPLSTIPALLAGLQRHGVERLDYILLTHIHIDHAGGTGALLAEYPEAQVVCHPQGVRHMVEPEQLWRGSQKVLGELAELYGEILPVPGEQIGFAEELPGGIRVFLTPGHAQHHCCFLLDDLLFGGEVAGVHCPVEGGIYLRPATPPRFLLEVALDSLRKMIDLAPRAMVIAHYGLVEPAVDYLRIAARQLPLWVRGIALACGKDGGEPDEQAVWEWLQRHDEHYRNQGRLANDIRARERYFLGNTVRGMSEYVQSLGEEERQALCLGR